MSKKYFVLIKNIFNKIIFYIIIFQIFYFKKREITLPIPFYVNLEGEKGFSTEVLKMENPLLSYCSCQTNYGI